MLPEEWLKKYGLLAGLGTAEGDHLRFSRSPGRPARRPAGRAARGGASTRSSQQARDAAAPLRRHRSRPTPPAGFVGTLRGYQRDGLGWLHFLQRVRLRRLPGRRHGPGQDGAGARPAGSRGATARAKPAGQGKADRQTPGPSLVVVPAVAGLQLEAGGGPLHAEAARPRPHRHRPRQAGRALRRLRPRPDHLRHAAPRRRCTSRTSRSTTSSSTRRRRSRTPAASRPRRPGCCSGRPPPGPERHAGREPPRRAVEPVRVPQPRHARQRLASSSWPAARRAIPSAETRDAAGPRPAAVHPAPHQGAGGARICPQKTEQTIYCELEAAQRKLYDELREHYRAVAAGARRSARASTSRRSRSSRRCCACARRPAIPA